MCGIFGIAKQVRNDQERLLLNRYTDLLFKLSETRGKEAAGMALKQDEQITVYKSDITASKFIKSPQYKKIWKETAVSDTATVVIGHSRLATNGRGSIEYNNQPVQYGSVVGVHNGIVVNHQKLWDQYPSLKKHTDIDTEVIMALVDHFKKKDGDLSQAIDDVFQAIYGETSIALLFEDLNCLLLSTNNGSLYYVQNDDMFIFASEKYILEQFQSKYPLYEKNDIKKLNARHKAFVNIENLAFDITKLHEKATSIFNQQSTNNIIVNLDSQLAERRQNLKRCSKCLLTETMPFIQFDKNGVCNYCQHYAPMKVKKEAELEAVLKKHRKHNGETDCVVAFSGGRDSCYGLHLLKTKYDMNPVAFTYDWGVVTDLARRNQARLCDKLEVEHIWVSADINQKRKNIRSNVNAWLKKPDLGMIPIFMAGDKQFYYYANKVVEQTGTNLLVMCENRLERTDFKTGFCGIAPIHDRQSGFKLNAGQNMKLISYYLYQYLTNPRYINQSVLDTLFAYASFYVLKHDYLKLFDYYPWNEEEVNKVLIEEYDWETAPDSPSTWRIGDGTAAFYNYIYYRVTGFTEFDTLRSNQIREGVLSRDDALSLVEKENQPRYASILEYCNMVGLDFNSVISRINQIPTVY